MEPLDPLSQLASCCFGRRSRNAGGFKTAAMRNQYLYSPSMAHMSPGSVGGWPMTASGIAPKTIITGGFQPQMMHAQPYILLTQPVIVNSSGQLESLQVHNSQAPTLAIIEQQTPQSQMQAIQSNGEPATLHKVPSIMPGQYNIYAAPEGMRSLSLLQHQQAIPSLIYESLHRQFGQSDSMTRNVGAYLNQQRPAQQLHRIAAPGQQTLQQHHQQRQRRLNTELFKRLEIIEKQVDLSEDMDLVERHGIVITRPIEPLTLAPHLTNEMLASYENHFLLDEEHVIKFIEIIKRPGQTLGLYIRAVHFENPQTRVVREGIVITKIESDSPVYTSRVLHIGDEILSINLIDVQGMVLDDVVTLMSIPKRLVLALRIPKERAEQELGCEMIKQTERQNEPVSMHQSCGQQGQMFNQRAIEHRVPAAFEPEKIQKRTLDDINQRLAHIPKKQQDLEDPHGHQSQGTDLHLARPARVRSAIPKDLEDEPPRNANFDFALTGEESSRSLANELPFLTNLQKTGATRHSPSAGELAMSANEISGSIRTQGFFEQPRSPGISRLDRQIAISQSIDSGRTEDLDRFRNYSMDPEIAKLEREALNRERPSDLGGPNLEGLSDRNDQNHNFSSGVTSVPRKVDQTPSTLPKRRLPTRPDMMSPPTLTLSPVSAANSSIISNIRLGETSEQSNFFTSSIDAINRELKELRQQRLAMSPCNESAPTEAPAENPALNFK